MNANLSGKRSWAALALDLLRAAWPTALALLLLVFFGLRAGWSTSRQWSDGLFIAGGFQVIIAAVSILATQGDALDASTLRYVSNSNIMDTRRELFMDTLRRKRFGLRVFLGAVLTFLGAAVVARV